VSKEQANQVFIDIDNASNLLGVSRRTFFEYQKMVHVKPEERKRIGQRLFFSEEAIARMWVLQRRNERGLGCPKYREEDGHGKSTA
jgi:DNA-binding transcriptional MerR regulator